MPVSAPLRATGSLPTKFFRPVQSGHCTTLMVTLCTFRNANLITVSSQVNSGQWASH
jgi:hypothetical protein